jgi:hypothetical protein
MLNELTLWSMVLSEKLIVVNLAINFTPSAESELSVCFLKSPA